jgi:hypothetical protein
LLGIIAANWRSVETDRDVLLMIRIHRDWPGRATQAFASLLFSLIAIAPCAAQSSGVSELFGARVQAVAGVKSPLAHGDFDGDGVDDAVYFVKIAPATTGRSIASDVQVVRLYGGAALGPASSGHALAITLKGGAQKLLIVDMQAGSARGFFDSPSWSDSADWIKSQTPLSTAKRGSAELKGYPCLGKLPAKSDVLLLLDAAGIDEALAWTGKTFKTCVDPTNDP